MKRQILLLVLLICGTQVFSQFLVFSEYFPFNKKTDVYPITSGSDIGLPLLTISGNDIKVFYLDNKYKLNKEISLKKPAINSKLYLGSYIIDSSLVIIFSNKTLKAVSQLRINLETGYTNEIEVEMLTEDQKYLASWERADGLFVLGIEENSNRLVVSKFYGNGSVSVHEYEIDITKVDQLNSENSLFDLFNSSDGKIQKIDTSIPVSLYLASAKNKTYLIDDEIIITIDYFEDATYYLSVKLNENICYAVQYPYYIPEFDRQASAKSNSFLFDSTIFQISINNDELVLKVERTTDTNNAFYYYANKDIEFSNSSMKMKNEKEGFLFGDPVVREIKSISRFLKMMRNMSPAISVFRKQSELQILLGSVVDIYQTAGLSANHQIASGGEMMVGPGGNLLMPDPVYVFPSNYSYSSYSSRKSVSFSTILDVSTYIHNNGSISKYTYDYIVEYANYMSGRYGLVTIFKMKGDYYLGYYSYGSHTYNLEWFKNVDDFSIQY